MNPLVASMTALAIDYPAHYRVEPHRHDRAQLLYASSGVMRVTTDRGTWVVPPERAVWIPSGVEHAIDMRTPVSMRTVYIRKKISMLPEACCVVNVSPLLRQLIVRAMSFRPERRLGARQERLAAVLLDEIRELPVAPLHLPRPRDSRLLRLTDALNKDPADRRGLDDWGREVGASSRTLARLFMKETGMAFRRWREQLRIILAVERLGAGEQVTRVAMELGYDSVSAFITMFRRNQGTTPSRYFVGLEPAVRPGPVGKTGRPGRPTATVPSRIP